VICAVLLQETVQSGVAIMSPNHPRIENHKARFRMHLLEFARSSWSNENRYFPGCEQLYSNPKHDRPQNTYEKSRDTNRGSDNCQCNGSDKVSAVALLQLSIFRHDPWRLRVHCTPITGVIKAPSTSDQF
jgi:hypothetical protein